AGRPSVRRDHQRLRRDARLRDAGPRRGSLGHHRLRESPAAERARDARGRAGRRSGQAAMTQAAGAAIPELEGFERRSFAVGAAAAAVSAVGVVANPAQFYQSYLMAYMWCLGATLGCLALGMVHQLSGGEWGVVIRREIGAASRVLPVMTLLFLP